MKALIFPDEVFLDGVRVVDTSDTGFDVAQPLFWVDCDEAVSASTHYYKDGLLVEIPKPAPVEPIPVHSSGLTEV